MSPIGAGEVLVPNRPSTPSQKQLITCTSRLPSQPPPPSSSTPSSLNLLDLQQQKQQLCRHFSRSATWSTVISTYSSTYPKDLTTILYDFHALVAHFTEASPQRHYASSEKDVTDNPSEITSPLRYTTTRRSNSPVRNVESTLFSTTTLLATLRIAN